MFDLKTGKSGLFSKILAPKPLIGLDFGTEKLNMVQVDFKSGEPVIVAASSNYHNSSYQDFVLEPEKFKALIKNTLKSAGFKGKKIVATVPNSLLKIIFLNFKCHSKDEEVEAILNGLKHRVEGNLNQYVIDYLPIKPQLHEQIDRVALVAMVKYEAVENFLDLLIYSGLSVEALEIGPVAIKRLITSISKPKESQKVLTINFGVTKSYLTVIWNDELLLDREIDFGMDNILAAVAKEFDVDNRTALKVLHEYGLDESKVTEMLFETNIDENNESHITSVLLDILRPIFFHLSEEIKDVLVYVASETRGGAVELIYLMGSLSRVAAVDKVIDRLVSIPVETINPFFGFSTDQDANLLNDLGPLSGVAVATGLSMRGKV